MEFGNTDGDCNRQCDATMKNSANNVCCWDNNDAPFFKLLNANAERQQKIEEKNYIAKE